MDRQTERFYDLIWPHRSALLRTAQVLVGGIHEAEDLTQETLVKAFRSIDRFQNGTDAKRWLMTILRNTRIDRLRAAAGTRAVSLKELPMEPAGEAADGGGGADEPAWENPQEILERFADQDIIRALQGLPEEVRWTLLLVDVEGLNQEEAAAILEVPVGTVKSRAHRGRGMLRRALLPVAKDRRYIHE